MDSKSYIHWEDFYRENWLSSFEKVNSIVVQKEYEVYANRERVLNELISFFLVSCKLFRYYLENNGLLFKDYKLYVKAAFRYGLIDNGDAWIELYHLVSNLGENLEGGDALLKFALVENFEIMKKLKGKFKLLLENNE